MSTTSVPIVDLQTATSTLVTSGDGTIHDLNVELNITHSYQGDVTVTLSNGIHTVTLLNRPGLPGWDDLYGYGSANFGNSLLSVPMIFDDQAPSGATYDSPQADPGIDNVTGSWLPAQGALAAFNGDPIAGTWTLSVSDAELGDQGTLTRWALCLGNGPAATGACCVAGGACSITTQAACSGAYLGDFSSCNGPDGTAHAAYTRAPNLPIPDFNGVPGVLNDTQTVADTYTVGSLTVQVNIPNHTYIGDLIISLTHGSTTVRLWNRQCGGDDGITCTFDDAAPLVNCPTAPLTPVTGSIKPNQVLSAFRGQAVNGDWTLTVSDNANSDTGTLMSWSITARPIGPSACVPTGPDCFSRLVNGQIPVNGGHFTRGGPNGVSDQSECLGDWDRDLTLAPADVAAYIQSWFYSAQNPGNLDADIDCDGVVVPADVAGFVQHWFNGLTGPAGEGC